MKFGDAKSFITHKKLIDSFDSFSPKLQFWIAYTLNKNGEKKTAAGLFQNIIEIVE